jgi:hypothetical protein
MQSLGSLNDRAQEGNKKDVTAGPRSSDILLAMISWLPLERYFHGGGPAWKDGLRLEAECSISGSPNMATGWLHLIMQHMPK